MVMPTFGTGAMAGMPILDTQGFGIPTKAKDPQSAAAFIDFMHTPESLQAMWTISKQVPADTRFDASVIDVPLIKEVHDEVDRRAENNVYIADLMPSLFWTDAMFVASQKILGGDMTGDRGRQARGRRDREVEEAEPGHGRQLPDLGQGPRGLIHRP